MVSHSQNIMFSMGKNRKIPCKSLSYVIVVETEIPNKSAVSLSLRDTVMTGHPVIRGHFLRTVSYLPHVKEPVMKGHFLSDIEVSPEDRFYCIEMSPEDRFYCL